MTDPNQTIPTAERIRRLLFRAATKTFYGLNLLDYASLPPNWRIVRYQRIIAPEALPYPIERTSYVRPKSFEMQLEYLKRECRPIDLNVLMDMLASGESIPPRTVAVVFEGGFRETFVNAFPLLQRYEIPAAVFLPTAFAGTDNMFWQDKVLLSLLKLRSLGAKFPKFEFLGDEFAEALTSVTADEQIDLTSIALLVRELEGRPAEERLSALALLGSLIDEVGGLEAPRTFLNWKEISEM